MKVLLGIALACIIAYVAFSQLTYKNQRSDLEQIWSDRAEVAGRTHPPLTDFIAQYKSELTFKALDTLPDPAGNVYLDISKSPTAGTVVTEYRLAIHVDQGGKIDSCQLDSVSKDEGF